MSEHRIPTVMVIEDDPEFGPYLKIILESSGVYHVELYEDGVRGLSACMKSTPDLLILDLDLPNLRGEEICRLLRSSPHYRKLPILVCSEMPEAQRKELELLKIGANAYIEKPFDEARFLQIVDQAIRGDLTQKDTGEVAAEPAGDGEAGSTVMRKPVFAGYKINKVLGGGAMGTVYEAIQEKLGRTVAIKVLLKSRTDTPEAVERFKREALIMAKLNHHNIIQIIDSGTTGFTYYIVMEHAREGSLDQYVRATRPTWTVLANMLDQVCDALIYLHEREIVHRDIKPRNVLVTHTGAAKIGDFGISRARLPQDQHDFTSENVLLGTPHFMAPELALGAPATPAADQFSFGRTLQHILELWRTPGTKDVAEDWTAQLTVPTGIEEVLQRATHFDPAQRFQDMASLRKSFMRHAMASTPV